MAFGAIYPAQIQDNTSKVIWGGSIQFTSSANQPSPSTPPITSGTLPNTGSWVSGTAKVNPVARAITVAVEIVTAGTNTIATCAVAISPDDSTYTTLGTPGASAAQNNAGATTSLVTVPLPQGWYVKLTFANCAVAASIYYQSVTLVPTSSQAVAPTGAAGGDLTGTYPNPTIGAGKVIAAAIGTNAVITAKVSDGNVTLAKLATDLPYALVQTGVPTTLTSPLVYDDTAVTGGLYGWTGAAYSKIGPL